MDENNMKWMSIFHNEKLKKLKKSRSISAFFCLSSDSIPLNTQVWTTKSFLDNKEVAVRSYALKEKSNFRYDFINPGLFAPND